MPRARSSDQARRDAGACHRRVRRQRHLDVARVARARGQRRVHANTLAALRDAALADEQGLALRAAIQGLGLESPERQP